jgi:hypothetical protein
MWANNATQIGILRSDENMENRMEKKTHQRGNLRRKLFGAAKKRRSESTRNARCAVD